MAVAWTAPLNVMKQLARVAQGVVAAVVPVAVFAEALAVSQDVDQISGHTSPFSRILVSSYGATVSP